MNFIFKTEIKIHRNIYRNRCTYQVQVFAGLTEKETLHAILLGLVYNMMESGIATSAKNGQKETYCWIIHHIITLVCYKESHWCLLDFGILFKALKYVHADM